MGKRHPALAFAIASINYMSAIDTVLAHPVVLVGAPGCGFCARAKAMLQQAQQEFQFYELAGGDRQKWLAESGGAEREELDRMAGYGRRTGPYLFVKGKYAGGCNDGPEPWMGVRKLLETGNLK